MELELAGDSFALVTATLDAIRERVPADAYVALVVLGSSPNGMTQNDLQAKLKTFLDHPPSQSFPWYLGLTTRQLANAEQQLSAPNAFADLLEYLKKNKWVDVAGGTVMVRPRNFEWGLSG